MTESSRSKTLEVMARAMQEKPTSWVTPTPWGMLCETVRVEWRKKAEAALTAYESHLQAEGMAVVPGWRPIGIAPRDGTCILGFFPDLQDGYHDTNWTRHGVWASRAYPNQPTYWQPLPAPPSDGKAFQPMGSAERSVANSNPVKERDDE